ncbi:hypothetical protein VE04_06022 [Pseudogymnoascus sp. 24MN13]|nr:hypothetical protein VE04_06022 [Pseudogymnoascus sp. 24MN13]
MAQTPQQRISNQKFAKVNTAKMGKPEGTLKKKQQTFKSPVSPIWLINFEDILQINEADQGGGEIDTRGKRNVAISNKMRDPNFKLHIVPNIIPQTQFNIRIED